MRTILHHLIGYHEMGTETEDVKTAANQLNEALEKLDMDTFELDHLIGILQLANYDAGFKTGFTTAFMLLFETLEFKNNYFRKD